MNLDEHRAHQAHRRALTPSLYSPHGGLDLSQWPGSIQPPEWMCGRHAASWRRWTDYKPYVPIVLMSIGTPVPPEEKRRSAIAGQREVIATICHQRCTPAAGLVQPALFDVAEVA
jgi:hypothetical protein